MITRIQVEASVQDYGQEHNDTLKALMELSHTLWKPGKLDESYGILQRVLIIRQRDRGPEHPEVLDVTHSLACSLLHRKELAKAEELFRQGIEVDMRVLGHEHWRFSFSIFDHSQALTDVENLFDAEVPLRNLVKDSHQRIVGAHHQDTIHTAYVWARPRTCEKQERYPKPSHITKMPPKDFEQYWGLGIP
ncbi:hypothetical protein DSL72_007211 [Monilinia vaccinii-corymbosi]|uniref:Kinesin light chain n=1 Tax=Monilinia vaccinii-corymbosi TaxID=61207 RepID=A0A8A3PKZ8_9HELO|nr:hypothetical protein DSL72_007211 [Monilinia vaccinii-corymbosi]